MSPVLRPEQVIKGLEKNGFRFVKQRGSHRKYKGNGRTVIVPMHYEIAKGTLGSVLEQAGLTLEQLMK
ncbi:MAG: type II toxin-antitoxin system HicA family toxin [Oscillospiraceae bacterium]|nr:type II toxin-antitoxin system HicA family toxin [Oscillospiraceae bacterium]